jgi:hypothetical protein
MKEVFTTKKDHDDDMAMLVSNMVTKEEHKRSIDKLIANMATKADLQELRGEFQELKDNFSIVMNSVDKILSALSDLKQEMAFSAVQYARQLEWNHKVGAKVGIPFEY